jgi:hypothetical protein
MLYYILSLIIVLVIFKFLFKKSKKLEISVPKMTIDDLKQYNGEIPNKPIYVGLKGRIFDVTIKNDMYGKDSSYNVFAGR